MLLVDRLDFLVNDCTDMLTLDAIDRWWVWRPPERDLREGETFDLGLTTELIVSLFELSVF